MHGSKPRNRKFSAKLPGRAVSRAEAGIQLAAMKPDKIVRASVGRMEVLAPWMRDNIVAALRDGDLPALSKYGRFLQPFIRQIGNTPHAASAEPCGK